MLRNPVILEPGLRNGESSISDGGNSRLVDG